MTRRGSSSFGSSRAKRGGWAHLFVTALFTAYIGYVPIHLATETHLLAVVTQGSLLADDHGGPEDADHDDSDHHTPHPASDHTLNLTTQTEAPGAAALQVVFLPAEIVICLFQPELVPGIPVFERVRPPGESPPGPFLPRAPPLI
jgi:hypothetical protein